ncbi:MAG: putative membrane protein [Colwellia sp.]
MRIFITAFVFIILLTIAFIFGSQNEQTLTLNYLIARTELSVAAAVSLFTTVGFLLGLIFSLLLKFIRMIKPKNQPSKELV